MIGKRHLINILLISLLLTTTSAAIALDQRASPPCHRSALERNMTPRTFM